MATFKYFQSIILFIVVLCKGCKTCCCQRKVSFQPAEHKAAKLPQKIYDIENDNVCQHPFVWILQDCITVINAEFVDQTTASEKCESIKTRLYDLEDKSKIKQAVVMNYVGKIYGWDSYWVDGKNNLTLNPIITSAYADKRLCKAIGWRGIHIRFCDELLGFICVIDTQNRTSRPSVYEGVEDFENKTKLLDPNHENDSNIEGLLLTTVAKSQPFFTKAPDRSSFIPQKDVSESFMVTTLTQRDIDKIRESGVSLKTTTFQQEEITTMATSSEIFSVAGNETTLHLMKESAPTFQSISSLTTNLEDMLITETNSKVFDNYESTQGNFLHVGTSVLAPNGSGSHNNYNHTVPYISFSNETTYKTNQILSDLFANMHALPTLSINDHDIYNDE